MRRTSKEANGAMAAPPDGAGRPSVCVSSNCVNEAIWLRVKKKCMLLYVTKNGPRSITLMHFYETDSLSSFLLKMAGRL